MSVNAKALSWFLGFRSLLRARCRGRKIGIRFKVGLQRRRCMMGLDWSC